MPLWYTSSPSQNILYKKRMKRLETAQMTIYTKVDMTYVIHSIWQYE